MLTGAPRTLRGSQPLALTRDGDVWIVRAGHVHLFVVPKVGQELVGERHHVGDCPPGMVLVGRTYGSYGLLAVPVGEATVERINLADLEAHLRSEGAGALTSWITLLAPVPPATVRPAIHQQGSDEPLVRLAAGQRYQPREGEVEWVRGVEGAVCWMGRTEVALGERWVPLSDQMWVTAGESGCAIARRSASEPTSWDEAGRALAWHHDMAMEVHRRWAATQQDVLRRRFRARQKQDELRVARGIEALGSVLSDAAPEPPVEGGALYLAAERVGRSLGLQVKPAPNWEPTERLSHPIEAIARASHLRYRRVLLRSGWQRQGGMPLVAFEGEELRPVALLPEGDGFRLVYPVSGDSLPLDDTREARLAREAYVLYEPLPDPLTIRALLGFVLRDHARDLRFMLFAAVMASLMAMVVPHATALLIDHVIPEASRSGMIQLGAALLLAGVGQVIFTCAQTMLQLRISVRGDSRLQPAVFDRLLKLKTSFLRAYSSGDLQTRVLSIGAIREILSGSTLQTLLSALMSLLVLVLMVIYSWKLALVGVAVGLATLVVTSCASWMIFVRSRALHERRGHTYGLVVQLIHGISKLRVAGAEGRAFATWAEQYAVEQRLEYEIQAINDRVSLFNTVMQQAATVVLFVVAAQLLLKPGAAPITTGTFLAFNAAFGMFLAGASSLSNTVTDVLEVINLWQRALPILEADPEVSPDDVDPGELLGGMSLERVCFRYHADGPLILEDVSVRIEPGAFVAFVGPSGSGKSTALRLLLGFEQPQSGGVYFDDKALAGLDVYGVRRQIGVVLQNGKINAGTIMENIAGGATISMTDAWRAAEDAGFADDIRAMPMGLHTMVSEGGSNLSGGQRQRMLIARALTKRPRILLFDEATSALDNRTQETVSRRLEQLRVTRVVVAHRLSTIRNADLICVFDRGQVVQQGSFAELAAAEGPFQKLIARQTA